ncbi:MAG: hypothetical protein J5596_01360 [Bacteroidaceae bacterium]|nr:hypothetical protein [Bacteroidaceae bacterium]
MKKTKWFLMCSVAMLTGLFFTLTPTNKIVCGNVEALATLDGDVWIYDKETWNAYLAYDNHVPCPDLYRCKSVPEDDNPICILQPSRGKDNGKCWELVVVGSYPWWYRR